ncbi:GRF1-interacting factor 1 [Platanthera guangdongensis]|uniref:GRF1-interacting factor 1 n=1 Tax=Platanthera guangdongensis TaxID=2320717 RepID=A0ABR2LXA3_9ASPA
MSSPLFDDQRGQELEQEYILPVSNQSRQTPILLRLPPPRCQPTWAPTNPPLPRFEAQRQFQFHRRPRQIPRPPIDTPAAPLSTHSSSSSLHRPHLSTFLLGDRPSSLYDLRPTTQGLPIHCRASTIKTGPPGAASSTPPSLTISEDKNWNRNTSFLFPISPAGLPYSSAFHHPAASLRGLRGPQRTLPFRDLRPNDSSSSTAVHAKFCGRRSILQPLLYRPAPPRRSTALIRARFSQVTVPTAFTTSVRPPNAFPSIVGPLPSRLILQEQHLSVVCSATLSLVPPFSWGSVTVGDAPMAKLQRNLMYLAAIADSQPQMTTMQPHLSKLLASLLVGAHLISCLCLSQLVATLAPLAARGALAVCVLPLNFYQCSSLAASLQPASVLSVQVIVAFPMLSPLYSRRYSRTCCFSSRERCCLAAHVPVALLIDVCPCSLLTATQTAFPCRVLVAVLAVDLLFLL